MPSLHELQRGFAAALFDAAGCDVCDVIRSDDIEPAERLQLYRTQMHATFSRALALEFPVIERLVGNEFFTRLARELQSAHASRSGDLQHIGAPFAAHLHARFADSEFDYLGDVAALEWAYQESTCAPCVPALDLGALQEISPADYGELHFSLHPACRLVRSRYPVLDIWRANLADSDADKIIDLASGGSCVLVLRPINEVEVRHLSRAEFVLLDALGGDLALGAAFDAAKMESPDFDLGSALRGFVLAGVLTGAKLRPNHAASA